MGSGERRGKGRGGNGRVGKRKGGPGVDLAPTSAGGQTPLQ